MNKKLIKFLMQLFIRPFAQAKAFWDNQKFLQIWAAYYRHSYWSVRLQQIGENSNLYPYVIIHHPELVSIGHHVSIGEYTHMWGGGGITIGNHVMIASHTILASQTHDPESELMIETSLKAPIVIEDNVWIGANAIILPGVTIHCGSIIGAGAVVTHDVPVGTITAGVPARAIRQRLTCYQTSELYAK